MNIPNTGYPVLAVCLLQGELEVVCLCGPAEMVTPAGLEPATPGLGNRCSIQLSYGASVD